MTTQQLNSSSKRSLRIFLNEHIKDINYDSWWFHYYPYYESKYTDQNLYYDINTRYNTRLDAYTGYIVTLLDHINMNDEEHAQYKYTQIYDSGPMYISPMSKLYHADMLFRKLIDYEIDYNIQNKHSYQTLYPNMMRRFYKFCKKYST
jgi:hypothetical protein